MLSDNSRRYQDGRQDESDVDEEKFVAHWRAAGRLGRLFGRELEELSRREMAGGKSQNAERNDGGDSGAITRGVL